MQRFFLQLALCAMAGVACAQAPQLTPPVDRITDSAIHADYKTYEATQARIKALNDRGVGNGPKVSNYHLAKAQCWLDVSFHEYTRNDRSEFPRLALEQSDRLIKLMEAKSSPLPNDTPLINDAERVRPDLWALAEKLKGGENFTCGAARTACMEVELVHAGNEQKQLGWRHGKPYIQMAEDAAADAEHSIDACASPPAKLVMPVPAAPAREQTLTASVLFDMNRSAATSIRPMTRERLDRAIAEAKGAGIVVKKIVITGYADRLNGTGESDYNQVISLKRARAVEELLVQAGLDRSLMQVQGRSDSAPVAACNQHFKSQHDLEECLLPNRRVEVEFVTLRNP